jgi:hypothetical protein
MLLLYPLPPPKEAQSAMPAIPGGYATDIGLGLKSVRDFASRNHENWKARKRALPTGLTGFTGLLYTKKDPVDPVNPVNSSHFVFPSFRAFVQKLKTDS